MKFIYFGSAEFSSIVLDTLYQRGFTPVLIVTQPDKPKGRGLKYLPTRVSLFAEEKGIPCVKPASIKTEEINSKLREEEADLFLVADYGRILPASLISLPGMFTIALHPSLLPRYRGCAPVNWAVINGDNRTGVTIFKINEKVDSGGIIFQKEIEIGNDEDVISLTARLAKEGAGLIIENIEKILNKSYSLIIQDEGMASFAPKLKKEDGRINWGVDASRIKNIVRGTLGWPSAYTFYKEKILKILNAEVIREESKEHPAVIVKIDKEGIYTATGQNILKIKKLKLEGKKEMDAYPFVCGYKVKAGEKFG